MRRRDPSQYVAGEIFVAHDVSQHAIYVGFVDRHARFVWLAPKAKPPKSVVGFDFDGATFTHAAGKVTFEITNSSTTQEHEFLFVKTDMTPDQFPMKDEGARVDEGKLQGFEELQAQEFRSDERRVGPECALLCRSEGWADH